MNKIIICFLLISVCCFGQESVKGFWLTNIQSDAMFTSEGLDKALEICQKYGFNTIYVVGWNRGYTQFPSEVMNKTFGTPVDPAFTNFDPIKYLTEKSKPLNIRVILWFEFGFAYRYKNETNPAIEKLKPEWIALNQFGQPAEKNGFYWLNAFDAQVQQFLIDLIAEAAQRYEIAGIQGDDRLPALPSLAGYNENVLKDFYTDFGRYPRADKDSVWVKFRADKLTEFLGILYKRVKAVKPDMTISLSPSIFPWSLYEYLQNWPDWINKGWVDELLPQVYRRDLNAYKKALDENVLRFVPLNHIKKTFPGILLKINDYYSSEDLLSEMIKYNRSKSLNGESFFYYEGIMKRNSFFESYRKYD